MKTRVKCVELRTLDGKVILVLYLYEKEIDLEDNQEQQKPEKLQSIETPDAKKELKAEKSEKPKTADSTFSEKEPLMTDAQKRYLFRILAERGIEGDRAYEHLKELFQVDSLKEVTRLEASKAIEALLSEGRGGKDGVPF